jgi:hypothetical protein
MADETTTTWADLMREAKGPLVEALKWKTVLLSEIRRDSNQRRWTGKQVTIPIFLAPQQGAGGITQTGTLNAPRIVDTEQAAITSGIVAIAVSFSTQVLNQAKGDENVWAEVMPTKMQRAEDAFGRVINEMMTGTGDALLAAASVATTASGGATQTVNVGTAANFYQLYAGRVVSILTRATGAPVAGSTGPVRIQDYNQATGIVTVQYPDGSNTSFAVGTTDGIYIEGSYGTAIQGIQQAVATAGIFEGINKTTVPAWRGVDASPGTATDPSLAVFDSAERKVYQVSGRQPDFYLVDPAVVDKFSQGLTSSARWAGEAGTLSTGWTGVRYRNKLLVPDFDMPPNQAIGIQKQDSAIYTLDEGPDWDDFTGSVLQRFGTRALPVEAWLVWMLQYGFEACNGFVKVGNLNRAT